MNQGPRRKIGTYLGADIYVGGPSGSKTVGTKYGANIVVDYRAKSRCSCNECKNKGK